MNWKPVIVFFPAVFFMITGQAQQAQLRWQKVDSAYGPLPSTVHVYQCVDTLNGFPFIAYYVSAKLKDKALQFTAQTGQGKRFTPQQYYRLEQLPLLVVNCTFFSFATNQNFNVVIRDGKMLSYNIPSLRGTGIDSLLYYYPTRSAIGIDRQRRADIAWLFTDSTRRWPYAFEDRPVVAKGLDSVPSIYSLNDIEWKWWKMRTAVGGGPVLIHDGKIFITDRQEQLFPDEGRDGDHHPRTAMGYTRDGRLIVLAIQGRTPGMAVGATLEEAAQLMRSLGCYEALNLDGGGSTCLLINGKETVRPSDQTGERPIPAVFLIRWNK